MRHKPHPWQPLHGSRHRPNVTDGRWGHTASTFQGQDLNPGNLAPSGFTLNHCTMRSFECTLPDFHSTWHALGQNHQQPTCLQAPAGARPHPSPGASSFSFPIPGVDLTFCLCICHPVGLWKLCFVPPSQNILGGRDYLTPDLAGEWIEELGCRVAFPGHSTGSEAHWTQRPSFC